MVRRYYVYWSLLGIVVGWPTSFLGCEAMGAAPPQVTLPPPQVTLPMSFVPHPINPVHPKGGPAAGVPAVPFGQRWDSTPPTIVLPVAGVSSSWPVRVQYPAPTFTGVHTTGRFGFTNGCPPSG